MKPLRIFLIFILLLTANAVIVSKKTEKSCKYIYESYYNNSATTCSSVVIINVGTGMSVSDYKELAQLLVSADTKTSTVAIIVDNNPGCLFPPNDGLKKDDGAKFAQVVNAAVYNVKNDVSICTNPLYFVGGHSGGGKGALNALHQKILNFSAAGYVGLDPYQIKDEKKIGIPSLFWGFNETTCAVNINQAAKAGYNNGNETRRLFYQVQTNHASKIPIPGLGELLLGPHCSFTDNGCFRMCNGTNFPWIRSQVAVTFNRFAKAVVSNNFDKSQFVIDHQDVILYANQELVPEPKILQPLKPAIA